MGQPVPLARALHARHWVLWKPGTTQLRLSLASELVEIEQLGREVGRATDGRICELTDLLELGAAADFYRRLAECAELARRSREPAALWNVRVLETSVATLQGRFADAETAASEALALGTRFHGEHARNFHGTQLWWLRHEQGRAREFEPVAQAFLAVQPGVASVRAAVLRLYVALEDRAAVAEHMRALSAADFADLPDDWSLLPTLAHLATACAFVADERLAERVYERLLPYDRLHVVLGPAVAYLGPVSFYLGRCSHALHELERAVAYYERALGEAEALGAAPTLARVRAHLAGALAERGAGKICRR